MIKRDKTNEAPFLVHDSLLCKKSSKALVLLIAGLVPLISFCQQSSAFDSIISKIEAQEINFPFPRHDTTIVVGNININNGLPILTYYVPKYQTIISIPPVNHRAGKTYEEYGGIVKVKNTLTLNLEFSITNWNAGSNTFTINLDSDSKTVPKGANTIIFSKISNAMLPLSFKINGVTCVYDLSSGAFLEPLKVSYFTFGAGVITLPVLPVKIVYAPVADLTKLNKASISNTTATNYTTSVALTTSNSITTPQSNPLEPVNNIVKDIGKALNLVPDPDVQIFGKALDVITSLIDDGITSKTIDSVISTSVTNQNESSVINSETESISALSSNGGPGNGDVICYYTNAQLVWFSDNGKLELSLLGYDPTLHFPSAIQLKQALMGLSGRPSGTKDPEWEIDSGAIASLLELDPFTGRSGASSILDPRRFTPAQNIDGGNASFQIGGAELDVEISHEVVNSDLQSSASTNAGIEIDKSAILGFLGFGQSTDQTVQSSYTKNESSQYITGQTIKGSFTLNGSNEDHYYCDVYFDNVFGTFAFRNSAPDLDTIFKVGGIVSTKTLSVMEKTKVSLKVGNKTFWTITDKEGRFNFRLPRNLKPCILILSINGVTSKLSYNGKPILNNRIISKVTL